MPRSYVVQYMQRHGSMRQALYRDIEVASVDAFQARAARLACCAAFASGGTRRGGRRTSLCCHVCARMSTRCACMQ